MSKPDQLNAGDSAAHPTPMSIRTGPGRVVTSYRAKIRLENEARDAQARKDAEQGTTPPEPAGGNAAQA